MLSVPTLWITIILDFVAMGLVWAYVMHGYPKFAPARFWAAASIAAALGAAITMLRGVMDPRLPLVMGGGLMVFASGFAAMGVRRFYDIDIRWRTVCVIAGATCAGLYVFLLLDDRPMRLVAYSTGQCAAIAMSLLPLFRREDERDNNPGARLAGCAGLLLITVHVVRCLLGLPMVGSHINEVSFSGAQAALILSQVFLGMALNFGFLLMAMHRLRNEAADLALIDDLTGVANRRALVARLMEECARSDRSGEPFALLVIDLDGFKAINDTHGHAAGDACLQHFTLMAQTRLRPGDLLARTGGDEFCILLPSASLREGCLIARRVLEVCRKDADGCAGPDIAISVSIGVAEWSRVIGRFPESLIAAADEALYAAKKEGKNRFAAYEPPPSLAPEGQPGEAAHRRARAGADRTRA